jgi:trehalose-6-phosphate synthase
LSPDVKDKISQAFEAKGAHCVHVDHRIRRLHHEGYCKNRLWSVLHYGLWRNVMDLQWEQDAWDAYQAVNRAFAQALMRSWRPGDHGIHYLT